MAPKAHIPLVRLARLGRVEKVLVPVHEVLHVLVDSGPRLSPMTTRCESIDLLRLQLQVTALEASGTGQVLVLAQTHMCLLHLVK